MPDSRDNGADPIGVQLAQQMVENLILLNRNMELNRKLHVELREGIDALCFEFEVFAKAMSILADVRNTKRSLSLADFVDAYSSADEELSEDEDDDDDGEKVEEPEPVGRG